MWGRGKVIDHVGTASYLTNILPWALLFGENVYPRYPCLYRFVCRKNNCSRHLSLAGHASMIFDLATVKCFNLNLLFIFSAFLLSVKRYSYTINVSITRQLKHSTISKHEIFIDQPDTGNQLILMSQGSELKMDKNKTRKWVEKIAWRQKGVTFSDSILPIDYSKATLF